MDHTPKEYDIIIIGGGIAGLYKAYQILNKHKKTQPNILLLESTNRLGGRIQTYRDTTYKNGIEAGAGRFHKGHKHLIRLIHKLGLDHLITKIQTKKQYIPSPNTPTPKQDSNKYINQVIQESKHTPISKLQKQTFLQYASQVLPHDTPNPSQVILNSFGYSSELTDMNAYDTIQLIENHYNQSTYYGLKGGMEQIVIKLVEILKQYPNFQYHLREPAIKIIPITTPIQTNTSIIIEIKTPKSTYTAKTCICTIIKEDLIKIPLFKHAAKDLNLQCIKNLPLCRIYTKFPQDPDTNEVWFQGLKKMTTNTNLRYIIPINPEEGTMMVSYTDNTYSDYWYRIYTTKGVRELNKELQQELQKIFPEKKIPIPTHTKMFYWKHGVAYYQPGFDSTKDLKKIRQPFQNIPIFIYGENYSEKNPQWIEGALEG